MPELDEVLVNYADQYIKIGHTKPRKGLWAKPGLVFSLNHSYIWGVIISANELYIGGARFLREFAGIGENQAKLLEKSTKFLTNCIKDLFHDVGEITLLEKRPLLGIRPADEAPIIGPLNSDSRILIATGYMGQGLCLGFMAGKYLSELIHSGNSSILPRILWPERLRKL